MPTAETDSLSNCIRLFSTGGRILQEEQGELEGIQSERRGRGNSSWKQERQRKSRPDPCKHHSRHRIKSVPSSHAKPHVSTSSAPRNFLSSLKHQTYSTHLFFLHSLKTQLGTLGFPWQGKNVAVLPCVALSLLCAFFSICCVCPHNEGFRGQDMSFSCRGYFVLNW
ncbi:unnamed protein product [Arctogadus glacialis]